MRGFFTVFDGDVHAECIRLSSEVLAHRAVVVSSVAFESHGRFVLCDGVCGRRVLWGSIMRDSLFQPKKKQEKQKPEKCPLDVSLKDCGLNLAISSSCHSFVLYIGSIDMIICHIIILSIVHNNFSPPWNILCCHNSHIISIGIS